tara:strand:+ start:331 stop:606 length:276 start_codon:yes stop_codon:yes gene_type:complete
MDDMKGVKEELSRMNEKFDKFIRLEEKHLALENKVDGIGDRIHKHANMIMELQHSACLNTKSVGQFEKLTYMVVGSIFAAVAYFVFESIAH